MGLSEVLEDSERKNINFLGVLGGYEYDDGFLWNFVVTSLIFLMMLDTN